LTGYMRDWLERPGEPASDLDLVVLLLNSLDLLEEPPDRLADLGWLGEVLADVGRDDIGGSLTAGDLPGLRELRESLRAVLYGTSPGWAATNCSSGRAGTSSSAPACASGSPPPRRPRRWTSSPPPATS
jgi:Putative stress-induced transcription regulator